MPLSRCYSLNNVSFASPKLMARRQFNQFSTERQGHVTIEKIRHPKDSTIQTAIIGFNGCGKTALVKGLVGRGFQDKVDPSNDRTIYECTTEIQNCSVKYKFTEMSNNFVYSVVEGNLMGLTDVVLIVFSIACLQSFEECLQMHSRIKESVKCPIIMVGNKSDLEKRECPNCYELDIYIRNVLHAHYVELSAKYDFRQKLLKLIYEEYEISRGPYKVTIISTQNEEGN